MQENPSAGDSDQAVIEVDKVKLADFFQSTGWKIDVLALRKLGKDKVFKLLVAAYWLDSTRMLLDLANSKWPQWIVSRALDVIMNPSITELSQTDYFQRIK